MKVTAHIHLGSRVRMSGAMSAPLIWFHGLDKDSCRISFISLFVSLSVSPNASL